MKPIDFSQQNTVFCDSLEALEWAYNSGLPRSASIKTSSPALLWNNNSNIQNIEARWNVEELKKFQSSIQNLSEDIFNAAINVKDIGRERALSVSRSAVIFHNVLYKAACLEEDDFNNSRLCICVNGKSGPSGNKLNPPWGSLMSSNELLTTAHYTLSDDKWDVLNTQEISYWRRYKLAGFETMVYRFLVKLMNKLPDWLFKKKVFIPNENELIIETAAHLMLKGVKVVELKGIPEKNEEEVLSVNYEKLCDAITPIINQRVREWVVPSAVNPTILLFKKSMHKDLLQFEELIKYWDEILTNSGKMKQAVLMNAPGNIKGQALSYICSKKSMPLIAAQHGVTIEISKLHGEVSVIFDNSVSDAVLTYNIKNLENSNKSYFSKAKQYVVGASARHIRMSNIKTSGNQSILPIVYISTHVYRGNLGMFVTWNSDYVRGKKEQKLVINVLRKLPHKVRYKTYPEDNRRYSDHDPVLNDVADSKNIELFDKKIDMRYLLSEHKVIVTSIATSTLGWPVMSGMPVVFINRKEKNPLTSEAHVSLSKGLFVFDDDDNDFYHKLRVFLSQPISEIEKLWEEKKDAREEMIRKYFSAYLSGSGRRAAKIIMQEYL